MKVYIFPVVAVYSYQTDKLVAKGSVSSTFRELFCLQLKVLLEFGDYFVFKQNCHRFCTLYLQELGLRTGIAGGRH
ncbi:hypothetical protein WJX77_008416 [Trebouxia sp. C0004]